jgi:hypothetical protein
MTRTSNNNTEATQQIEAQESELKELLCRVMSQPLQPLTDHAEKLEKLMQNVEKIAKATADVNLPAMQRTIEVQGEQMRKNLKGFREEFTEELTDLLVLRLASMPQEISQLLQGQMSVKKQLCEVQSVQTLQGQRAIDTFVQSEALLLKSLGQISEIDISSKAAAADLVPTLSRQTDELSSRLESTIATLRRQSEKDRNELSDALREMEKRFFLLSVLCGLSVIGSIGLAIGRFALHL